MAKKSRTPAPPRKVQAPQRRVEPRRRRSPEERKTLWIAIAFAASGIAAIAIVAAIIFATGGKTSSSSGKGKEIDQSQLVGLQTGPAPWNAGLDHLPDRLGPLGLHPLTAEGQVIHIHQHLDIFVNGKRTTVPAGIGIFTGQFITELHTHPGEPGVIHVESPTNSSYTLGQFFGVWGVRLTADCIGGYCKELTPWRMYLDGKRYAGNPSTLVLNAHEEIAFVIGKPPKKIPSTYNWTGL